MSLLRSLLLMLLTLGFAACTAAPPPTTEPTAPPPTALPPTEAPTTTPLPTATSPAGGDTVALGLTDTGWAAFENVTAQVGMTVLTAGRAPLEWRYEFAAEVLYEPGSALAQADVTFTQLDRDSGEVKSEQNWRKVTAPSSFFLLGFPEFESECVAFPNEGQWPLDPTPNGLIPMQELITAQSFPGAAMVLGPGEAIAGQPTTRYRLPYAIIAGQEGEAELWLWNGTEVIARLAFEDPYGNLTTVEIVETNSPRTLELPSGCEPHGTPQSPEVRRGGAAY